MSLKIRRIIFIFFIISFLIIAPVAIFYASGYKFVFGKKFLQKTGMLVVDSEPKGAKIFLNGKPQKYPIKKYFEKNSYITTPAKIKNIIPSEYNVKIEKDGYWGWGKKLEIKPGMATFAEDIFLFKKNLPILIDEGKKELISPSPDNNFFAIYADKKIELLDLRTEEKKSINADISDNIYASSTDFLWSASGKSLIFGNLIINTSQFKNYLDLSDATGIKNLTIKWNNKSDGEIIYFSNSAEASQIKHRNLITDDEKTIYSGAKIIDFIAKDENLYFVEQKNKTTALISFDSNAKKVFSEIDLPNYSGYFFINANSNLINLLDKKHQILYLINPASNFPVAEIISNVKFSYWVSEKILLFGNEFEIWLFDMGSGKKTLLTRISEPIVNILWHPNNNYIIYATAGSIFTIELDNREKRNITELIKLDYIDFAWLNNEGDILYFYARIGNQNGIYKFIIQ